MESHSNTDNYGGLISVEMPVEMTEAEIKEEEEKKRTFKQRNEKSKR